MTGFRIVRQGESVPFIFDRSGLSIDGWICTIKVKQFSSDTSLITREVEADPVQEQWEGFITASESLALDQKDYRLIGLLTNAETGEEEQPLIRFNVTSDWGA